MKQGRYSEELKKKVVFQVLGGEARRIEIAREHGIPCSTLYGWLEKYGHGILLEHKDLLSQMGKRKTNSNTAVKGKMPELEELRHKLAATEKKLEQAELRAEAYSLMIDLAERELKVAIRKKPVTK